MSFVDLFESSEHRNNVAHFSALVSLARADGDFNENEINLINQFAKKLDITDIEYKDIFKDTSKYPIQSQYSSDKRLEILLDFFKIIYSDHSIDEQENKLIMKYAIGIGFNEENAKSIINKTIKIFNGDFDLETYKAVLKII